MTALEIIKKSAVLLNVKEILEDSSLNDNTTDSASILDNNFSLNRMFEILKILLNDMAYEIQPIENQGEFQSENKEIDLSLFKNLIKIVQVKKDGVSIKFSLKNGKIVVPFDSNFVIHYTSFLSIDSLFDTVDLSSTGVSTDILIYGLTAFYCLAVGLFDEFNVYNAIYNDKIVASKKMRIIEMPNRRWE